MIQDYGFRLYNPSIGKFLSVDPLAPEYPWNSTYAFAENSPIANVDLDGLEIFYAADGSYINKWGTSTEVRFIKAGDVASFNRDIHMARSRAEGPRHIGSDRVANHWAGRGSSGLSGNGMLEDFRRRLVLTIDDVIPKSTFVSQHNWKAMGAKSNDCWDKSLRTCELNGYTPEDEHDFFGGTQAWKQQMYLDPKNMKNITTWFKQNGIDKIDLTNTQLRGFRALNEELEAGRPLIIGVTGWDGSSNNGTDMTTDHFLVLTGRGIDENGNLYFTGWENGWGTQEDASNRKYNRFYPDSDGTIRGYTTQDSNEGTDNFPSNPKFWTISTVRKMK